MTPEEKARQEIDKPLEKAGWRVEDYEDSIFLWVHPDFMFFRDYSGV